MPKKIASANADDHDVDYPPEGIHLGEFLDRCSAQMADLPPPMLRSWISGLCNDDKNKNKEEEGEKIRLLQWNVLSQGELLRYVTHCNRLYATNGRVSGIPFYFIPFVSFSSRH